MRDAAMWFGVIVIIGCTACWLLAEKPMAQRIAREQQKLQSAQEDCTALGGTLRLRTEFLYSRAVSVTVPAPLVCDVP